jgi:hypothetical protein
MGGGGVIACCEGLLGSKHACRDVRGAHTGCSRAAGVVARSSSSRRDEQMGVVGRARTSHTLLLPDGGMQAGAVQAGRQGM